LILSGVFIFIIPFLAPEWLPRCRAGGPAWGAVLASAVIMGPPAMLLGTVSPIIIRLTFKQKVANTAGGVYAVSTLGSIGGTFFTAFYAIPMLGTRASLFAAGLLVVLAVACLALAGRQYRYLAVIGLPLLAGFLPSPNDPPGLIYKGESVHNIIRVIDRPSSRSLYLNYTGGAQTMMRKDRLLTGQYYDYFLLGPLLNQAKTVLFLGVAGGISLKQLVTVYPEAEVVGVELDPEVLEVAQNLFSLKASPRLQLKAEDARWYLENTFRQFDLIAIDLYVTGHIPFFTTSKEFFGLVNERLTPKGMVIVHVRSVRQSGELLLPFIRTIRAVFPSVFCFGRGNYMVVASKAPVTQAVLVNALKKGAELFPQVRPVVARAMPGFQEAVAGDQWPVFTDDRNDVEFRTFRASFRHR